MSDLGAGLGREERDESSPEDETCAQPTGIACHARDALATALGAHLTHHLVQMRCLGGEFGQPINPVFADQLKAKKIGSSTAYNLVNLRLKQMTAKKPSFDPFKGPLKDRNGVVRVPAGKTATVGDLVSMEWAAPGVVGAWPNEPK